MQSEIKLVLAQLNTTAHAAMFHANCLTAPGQVERKVQKEFIYKDYNSAIKIGVNYFRQGKQQVSNRQWQK